MAKSLVTYPPASKEWQKLAYIVSIEVPRDTNLVTLRNSINNAVWSGLAGHHATTGAMSSTDAYISRTSIKTKRYISPQSEQSPEAKPPKNRSVLRGKWAEGEK
jgi:hypothetical protein